MNRTTLCHLTLILCLAFISQASATSPASRYILRVFTVPKADGMELLAQPLNDRTLFQKLTDAVKANPSVLEKLIVVTGNDHDEIEVQLADELRYPTEFDPQQLPQQLAIGDAAIVQALQSLLEPKPDPAPEPAPPSPAPKPDAKPGDSHPDLAMPKARTTPRQAGTNGGLGIITAITPTAFEMRPLGDRLTLTSFTGDDKGSRSLHAFYNHTRLLGFDSYNGEMQPAFSQRQVNGTVTLMRDTPFFLGTCTAAAGTGTKFGLKDTPMSFALLTVSSIKAEPAFIEAAAAPATNGDLLARFEVISLPKTAAAALIDSSTPDAALRTALSAEITASHARMESQLVGRIRTDTSKLAETDEYIYGKEFQPPQIPQSLAIADAQLLADLRAGKQSSTKPPSADAPHSGGFGFLTTATATSFEMRELGVSIELETTPDDDGWTVHTRPSLSRLIGERHYAGVTQPVFESQTLTTTVPMTLSTPRLLGTLNRPLSTGIREGNQDDRVWFAFLTFERAK